MVSPSRQCSSTPVGFGQGFLSKEQCDNNEISLPTILIWLQLVFHLLPRPKSEPKARRFCGTTDTTENATEELKKLSQNGFQECLHLYSRWQKCTAAQAEYPEGNVA